ncbi:outer membrane protein assembly factor BamC [Spongiibacter sp. KMU-158]|uniref:Outer membrane protein assembly factor BamC n=1 Tax=Spongiibacter pelagi TaxID=2760804 RepID=A0A927C076_9GAMM|nr:outer membrane protein assembly factor BamC [Spongiibacter pelagi]MBD2858309.1 outer membrane protein assembly factor BamC [Spongiibacter pelagi]
MPNLLRPALLLSATVVLSACGLFHDRSNDYRKASLEAPLSLPPGVQSETLKDRYAVPGIAQHQVLDGDFVIPRPDGLAKNVGYAEVRIQKLGAKTWILSEGSPSEVWGRVREFMNYAGLTLAYANGEQGILETEWRSPDSSRPLERFRFTLEQGVQIKTTEISVLAQTGARTDWPKQSTDAPREAAFVKSLAQHLADSQVQTTVSVLARNVAASNKGKIFLEGEGEKQYLRLFLPSERAWAALGLALEKAGFEVEEAHRNVAKYWVSYVDPDRQPGWLARKLGADKVTSRYVVEMQELSPRESLILLNYQQGRRLSNEDRERMLTRIMGYTH